MDALAGILSGCAIKIPNKEAVTAITIPKINVFLKVVDILDAMAAGKIMSEVIRSTPMDLTPMTINNDVKIASK